MALPSFFTTSTFVKPESSNSPLFSERISAYDELPMAKGKKRLEAIGAIALWIIQNCPQKQTYNALFWKSFGLQQAEFSSRYQSLTSKGTTISGVSQFQLDILQLWKKRGGLFFQTQITHQLVDDLILQLERCKRYDTYFFDPATPVEEKVKTLQKEWEKLLKKEPIYLPLGYRGGKIQTGHALTLKLELINGTVIATLFNLGAGVSLHPVVDKTAHANKVSFRYFPIEIKVSKFFGEDGKAAFCHLLRYCQDEPSANAPPYEAEELYAILQTLGTLKPEFPDQRFKIYGRFPQITGNCSVLAVELLIIDRLVTLGYEDDAIEKIMLNFHLCSLIQSHLALLTEPKESYLQFLKESASVLGIELQNLKNQMSEKEFICTASLLIYLLSQSYQIQPPKNLFLQEAEMLPIVAKPQVALQPLPTHHKIFGEILETYAEETIPYDMKRGFMTFQKSFDPIKAEAFFLATLETHAALEPTEKISYLAEVLTSLPMPKYEEEDVWDEVPSDQITPLIQSLKQLLISEFLFYSDLQTHCVLTSILYCISDKLIRRKIPQLAGYASPFPFLDKTYEERILTIFAGRLNQCYKAVYTYFKQAETYDKPLQKNKPTIFPFEKTLFVEDAFNSLGEGRSPCHNHIRFLAQFAPEGKSYTLDLALDLWRGKSLPLEVNELYVFAIGVGLSINGLLKINREATLSLKDIFNQGSNKNKKIIKINEFILSLEEKVPLNKRPLFSTKVKETNTNEAILAEREHYHNDLFRFVNSPHTFSSYLRIWNLQTPSLRLHQLLQWLRLHPYDISRTEVQEILIYTLFSPRALEEALNRNSECASIVRETFTHLISIYASQPTQANTLEFLIFTGLILETHLYSRAPPPSQEALAHYSSQISALIKNKEILYLDSNGKDDKITEDNLFAWRTVDFFVQILKNNKSHSDWGNLISLGFELDFPFLFSKLSYTEELTNKTSDLITQSVGLSIYSIYKQELTHFLKGISEEETQKLCSDCCLRIFDTKVEGKWTKINGIFENKNNKIDFYSFTFVFKSKTKYKNPYYHNTTPIEREKEAKTGFWNQDLTCWTSDQQDVRYISTKRSHRKQITIQYNGETRWIEDAYFEDDEIPDFVTCFFPDKKCLPWFFVEKKKGDPDFLLCDPIKVIPFCEVTKVEETPPLYEVVALSDKGEKTNYLAAATTHPDFIRTSHPFFRLAPPEEFSCLIERGTNAIQTLNFFNGQIQFKRNSEGLLECIKPYPGYYLDLDTHPKGLGNFQGAMVLINEYGTVKTVIIPRYLFVEECITYTDLIVPSSKDSLFFTYERLSPTSDFSCSNPLGYLYLGYILFKQKNYSEAVKYLKKIQEKDFPYQNKQLKDFLEACFSVKDGSIESICLKTRLAYLFFAYQRSLKASHFTHSLSKALDPIEAVCIQSYEEYLRITGGEKYPLTSRKFLLTKEEEKLILFHLKERYPQFSSTFPKLYEERLNLLIHKMRGGEMDIGKIDTPIFGLDVEIRKISAKNEKYFYQHLMKIEKERGSLQLPSFPIRVSTEQILANFFTLFHMALAPNNDSFKYLLLAIRNQEAMYGTDLRKILAYILTYAYLKPYQFNNDFKNILQVKDKDSPKVKAETLSALSKSCRLDLPKKTAQTFHLPGSFTIYSPFIHDPDDLTLSPKHFSYVKAPLRVLSEIYFDAQPSSVTVHQSLPRLKKEKLSPLAISLLEEYAANQPKESKSPPLLKLKKNPSLLRKELNSLKTEHQNRLLFLEKEIEKLFSDEVALKSAPFQTHQEIAETLDDLLTRKRGNIPPPTPEEIMFEVILKNKSGHLLSTFPLLTEKHINQLVSKTQEFFHLKVVELLINNCLKKVDQLPLHPENTKDLLELYELLQFEFRYDPNLYPEISAFVSKTSKLLRPKQVDIHLWQCDQINKNGSSLFQGRAGLGKSEVLTPLLILRLLREEGLPFIFTTEAMYSIYKTNLSATLSLCGITLGILEVGLHTKLSAEKLKLIGRQLFLSLEDKHPILLTPSTYYALKLMYWHALYYEAPSERIETLAQILYLIHSKVFLICDELHDAFAADTTAIYGFGHLIQEDVDAYPVYLDLIYPLVGFETLKVQEKTAQEIFQLLQNMSDDKESATADTHLLSQLQKALSEVIVPRFLINDLKKLKIKNIDKEIARYCHFVQKLDAAAPDSFDSLKKCDKKSAEKVGYMRFFLTTLLPSLTQMRVARDHDRSPYTEQEYHTPYHRGNPSTTQYKLALQSIAVTIKGVCEQGLTENQVLHHIEQQRRLDFEWLKIQEENSQILNSSAQKRFNEWSIGTPFEEKKLSELNLDNKETRKKLVAAFSKNKALISYVLKFFILPNIKLPEFEIQLASPDIVQVKKTFAFSATPGAIETLPTTFNQTLYDPKETATVLSKILEDQNTNQLLAETFSPPEFFTWLNTDKSTGFNDCRVLIDMAGIFCHLSNKKIAKLWLQNSELEGVLFFQKSQIGDLQKEEKITLLTKENGRLISHSFEGSHIRTSTQNLGVDFTKIGIYYDVSHTESADIPLFDLFSDFKIFFIPGYNDQFTASSAIQAVMRVRDFLDPAKKRTLVWIFPRAVVPKSLSRASLYKTMLTNEAKLSRTRIVLAASQGIVKSIRNLMESELIYAPYAQKKGLTAQEQKEKSAQYRQGFVQNHKIDPSTQYCIQEVERPLGPMLREFSTRFAKESGLSLPLPQTCQTAIDQIIERAEKLVPSEISMNLESPSQEIQIEMDVDIDIKLEQKQEAHKPKPINPITPAWVVRKGIRIKDPAFLTASKYKSSQEIFGQKITPFYFSYEQLNTGIDHDQPMFEKLLKPIDFFIVCFNVEGVHVIAQYNEIVETAIKDLDTPYEGSEPIHRALIMTADGKVIQRGKEGMHPTREEERDFFNSSLFHTLLIDAAFLGLSVPSNPLDASKRIADWGLSFKDFFKKVYEAHLHKPNTEVLERLMEIGLKNILMKEK